MKTIEKKPSPAFAAFLGVDWADQEHRIWLQPADGSKPEARALPQKAEAIQDFIAALRQRFGGQPIALAIECIRGPLMAALLGCEFLTLYPVNPKSLARYREAFRPSGAKDDDHDAFLLCDLVWHHRDQLLAWQPEEAAIRQLSLLVAMRRHWVDQRTALVERLRADLKAYYPLVVELFTDMLKTPLVAAFLKRWPNLTDLQKAKASTLQGFFHQHHSRAPSLIQERIEQIQKAQPLTQDIAILGAYQQDVLVIVEQLIALEQSIQQLDHQITQLFEARPDAAIFKSLPGAGPVLAPRLLAFLGTQKDKFPDAQAAQQYSGIAPITRQSGQSKEAYFRFARPRFLHQTWVEYARCSVPNCAWAQTLVKYLMEHKGKGYHEAIRVLAFKWMRIIWRMWQNQEPYDEHRYLKSLQQKQAPGYPKTMLEPS